MGRPQRIELLGDHRALHIELILAPRSLSVQARPDRLASLMPSAEPFTDGAGAVDTHLLLHLADGRRDFPAFVVFSAVDLAVALKAAPLIEMKQRAPEFERSQRRVEPSPAQLIGIQGPQRLTLFPLTSRKMHQIGPACWAFIFPDLGTSLRLRSTVSSPYQIELEIALKPEPDIEDGRAKGYRNGDRAPSET